MNYTNFLQYKKSYPCVFSSCNLYRLAVVFLAFDVFFAVFCVALACLIGIALCCCLPCIIGILYAVAGLVCFSFIMIEKSQILAGLPICLCPLHVLWNCRRVHLNQISVYFQNLSFMRQVMRKHLVWKVDQWFPLKIVVVQMNEYFHRRMRYALPMLISFILTRLYFCVWNSDCTKEK